MSFYSLFLISIALSLDAFGVALSIGLNDKASIEYKIKCIISFGFFQFFFSIMGAYTGFLFNKYVATMPQLIGGIIIIIVGILMIKEGLEENEDVTFIKSGMWIILGISVSIDAMVIGFTVLNDINNNTLILKYTLFIGLVTLIVSTFAFVISKYLKKIELIGKYADYIGGIILIIFGIKMVVF